jgi:hypothetical protein
VRARESERASERAREKDFLNHVLPSIPNVMNDKRDLLYDKRDLLYDKRDLPRIAFHPQRHERERDRQGDRQGERGRMGARETLNLNHKP